MSWNQSQNAFNSNRCDRDLCHKMTYITVAVACLISQLYRSTPLYLSGIDKIFRSKEVLYDLVAWKISKLPAFKFERYPECMFWRNLHSKSWIRCHMADFEGWQLCNLSTYNVMQYLFEKISSLHSQDLELT